MLASFAVDVDPNNFIEWVLGPVFS
jgi:hypothetical protein